MSIFTASKDTSQQMADSLPTGKIWDAKNVDDSNTRGLINSVSVVHNRIQQTIELLANEFDINNTTDLLEEWEISVGLPSDCATSVGSNEQRRQEIIERLRKTPLVTLAPEVPENNKVSNMQAFVDAIIPDVTIVLYAGEDYTSYPVGFSDSINKKFLIIAEVFIPESFEYTFEYQFLNGVDTVELECRMDKVIPANVNFITYFI